MQRALVSTGDKPGHFCGSREWIGTFEASVVLDHFYDVPCRIVHRGHGGGGSLLLIADPHYHGPAPDRAELQRDDWIRWTPVSELDQSSFYNLCLPQTGSIRT
ncbi:hypothetical protein WMY93_014068 [Mugilogobius chulae]|uniref:UFSP1/2/DUB catalytic domain-containing protein n=1 Tax=Mugilogobius chulae TaxID=88201 RepID=A0AAW0NUA1_9GOBI